MLQLFSYLMYLHNINCISKLINGVLTLAIFKNDCFQIPSNYDYIKGRSCKIGTIYQTENSLMGYIYSLVIEKLVLHSLIISILIKLPEASHR